MANKNFDYLQMLGEGLKVLVGSFRFNGSSSPTTTQGTGFTVTRASAGTHTLTLSDSYNEIVAFIPTVERDDPTTAIYDINFTRASTSSSVITVETYTDDGDGTGTVEDTAAGSNNGNWCHFIVLARNTGVGSTA